MLCTFVIEIEHFIKNTQKISLYELLQKIIVIIYFLI